MRHALVEPLDAVHALAVAPARGGWVELMRHPALIAAHALVLDRRPDRGVGIALEVFPHRSMHARAQKVNPSRYFVPHELWAAPTNKRFFPIDNGPQIVRDDRIDIDSQDAIAEDRLRLQGEVPQSPVARREALSGWVLQLG